MTQPYPYRSKGLNFCKCSSAMKTINPEDRVVLEFWMTKQPTRTNFPCYESVTKIEKKNDLKSDSFQIFPRTDIGIRAIRTSVEALSSFILS